jgi:hypothetical protein
MAVYLKLDEGVGDNGKALKCHLFRVVELHATTIINSQHDLQEKD